MTSSCPAAALGNDDPWTIAKTRFLADLDDKERELFLNATLENLYYSTSNANRQDAENSKTRATTRRLGPFVSAIENYGKALDTFSNIAPLYLAPIWGSIRVVLVMARAHGRFYDRMVDTLERIGDILPRFRDYERIYDRQKHQRLTQALSNAYLDIIVLCTKFQRSLREQRTSSVRRLLKPLSSDNQFDEAIDLFRQHRNNVEEEARMCHMVDAAEQRNAQLLLWAAERRRKLLSRLSNIDCKHRHRILREARHEGTGVWLTARHEYRSWGTPDVTSVLCCFGIPGCGKSVIASSVIDSLRTSRPVFYYYCDYADKRTLEPANVFGTLARQCLEGMETFESLADDIEQAGHDGERLTDQSKALDLIQKAVNLYARQFYIVLDGLDEANESSQKVICDGLRQLLNNASVGIKLFITGREELGSLLRIKPTVIFYSVLVSPTAIELDIDSYVRASTRLRIKEGSLVIRDPALEELIVQELVKGAKGMFLWVEFQLRDLSEAESDASIKLVLKNLPQSLSETYDRLLRIEGAERRELIKKLFKWIVCARQPLHVEELREGIAFTLVDTEWDSTKIVTNFNRLVRACRNLVIVDSDSQIVQLAHYTVQQYLLRSSENPFCFTIQEANIMAGEFCVAYLSFSNFDTQLTRYKENVNTDIAALNKIASKGALISPDNPARGVFEFWKTIRHQDATAEVDLACCLPRKMKVSDFSGFGFLSYLRKHWLWHTVYFDSAKSIGTNRRDMMFFDLVSSKQLLFEFRPWGSFDNTNWMNSSIGLLGWALMANHSYLLELVIYHKLFNSTSLFQKAWTWFTANKNAEDEPFCILERELEKNSGFPEDSYSLEYPELGWLYSRLLHACRKGHLNVIRTCDLWGPYMGLMVEHLIYEAAASGNLRIIDYFHNREKNSAYSRPSIARDFYINFPRHRRRVYTMHAAISTGCLPLVKALSELEYPCDGIDSVMSDKASYFRMINSATGEGNYREIECLLFLNHIQHMFYSREITFKEPEMTEALVTAVRLGHGEIVEMLLKHGVDPDTKDQYGIPILILAIQASYTSVVEMLLRHRCSTSNTPYGLPLTVAASLGDIPIARLLLGYGAETFSETFHHLSSTKLVSLEETLIDYPQLCLSPTPLYMACYRGHRPMVDLLTGLPIHGAAVDFASPPAVTRIAFKSTARPISPYISRIYCLFLDTLETTHEIGSIDWTQEGPFEWRTPMEAALSKGHKDIVELLLERGALLPTAGTLLANNTKPENSDHQRRLNIPINSSLTEPLGNIINNEREKVILTSFMMNKTKLLPIQYGLLVAAGARLETRMRPIMSGRSRFLWAIENNEHQLATAILLGSVNPTWLMDKILSVSVQITHHNSLNHVRRLLLWGADLFRIEEDTDLDLLSILLCGAKKTSYTEILPIQLAMLEIYRNLRPGSGTVGTTAERCFDAVKRSAMELPSLHAVTVRDFDTMLHYVATYHNHRNRLLGHVFTVLAIPISEEPKNWVLGCLVFVAIEIADYERLVHLCDDIADIDIKGLDGITPLMYASQLGRDEQTIQVRLRSGANPGVTDWNGESALYKAVAGGHKHVVSHFTKISEDNLKESHYKALELCVVKGRQDLWTMIAGREGYEVASIEQSFLSRCPGGSYTLSRAQYLNCLPSEIHSHRVFERESVNPPVDTEEPLGEFPSLKIQKRTDYTVTFETPHQRNSTYVNGSQDSWEGHQRVIAESKSQENNEASEDIHLQSVAKVPAPTWRNYSWQLNIPETSGKDA
ncbi:Ankyrin [Lachnellula willkommii]|uniref:Ankyrin n=1 Tax=Lachnellula willkommii TaxID=215461 RepID=A0A559MJH2_9HELO|nr:Ankyrin [Lachnellula willkommii]